MSDIIITWPKKRSLESYLDELRRAVDEGLTINFRVPSRPKVGFRNRCYVVHDGYVRGWNEVIRVAERDDVIDPISGELMRPGIYVERHPRWHRCNAPHRGDISCHDPHCTLDLTPMKGFQGYRYVTDELAKALA